MGGERAAISPLLRLSEESNQATKATEARNRAGGAPGTGDSDARMSAPPRSAEDLAKWMGGKEVGSSGQQQISCLGMDGSNWLTQISRLGWAAQ